MSHSGVNTAREIPGRQWRFGECEFDELRRELRVRGTAVELESKPLDVLLYLLQHAGEVVTKEELLDAVWPGLMVVEGSLATAMSKLRKAIGDEDQLTILTVPRIGYRLAVPAQSKVQAVAGWGDLGLKGEEPVLGREQWRLKRRLEALSASEVWLAENPKTHELRVFKFAVDGDQLKGLKREVTVSRLLRESLGERPDLVRVLEWNFETQPFFLESEYGGTNLSEWAENHGGLKQIDRELRLKMLIDIAKAVAAAHDVGVLHKDLKPANILLEPAADAHWQIKVADFGSASLIEPSRLGEMGITNLGFTQTQPNSAALTGTLMYIAPEVLAGQSPTASADVYAIGVILYQMLVGDFRKPLSAGWENEIEDAMLREDIAAAACGDPARRLTSAAELADRLEKLELRRQKKSELQLAEQRAVLAERKLAEWRARRPWVGIAIAALAVGLITSLVLYRRASRDRDTANRQTAIATATNRFLANDLLGRSNPFKSGKADETLLEAVKRASPAIDQQFAREPEIAARLHQTIARALDLRTDYADARTEYQRAYELFTQTEGPLSKSGIVVQLQRAAMEVRTYQEGALPTAKSILAEQEAKIAKSGQPSGDILVWLANARGMIALIENHAKAAAENFQAAVNQAGTLPEFDENARLTFKQRLAFSNIRLGNGKEAERLFRELIAAFTRTNGAESPDVLRVRLNLAQALMIQGKNADAVEEANQIYPGFVEKLGRDHELTMQLLTTRAQCEGTLERWDDAIRDGLEVHQLAVQKQGPTSFFAIATLSDVALAQCRSQRYKDGEGNARQTYEASRKTFGERAGLTGGTAYALASCLIDQNKLAEASKLLADIDVPAVTQLAGIADWGANVDLARAEIALRQKDYAGARAHLKVASDAFSRPDAEAYQKHKAERLLVELGQRESK